MREIKFRGKRVDNKKWVYGGISIFEKEAVIFDENDIVNCAYDVKIETVSEFCGITDNNGIDIYEKDICKLYFYDKMTYEVGEVIFDDLEFKLYVKNNDNTRTLRKIGLSHKGFISVMGNMIDNPERLNN